MAARDGSAVKSLYTTAPPPNLTRPLPEYRQLRRLLVSRRNDVSSRENQSPVPGSQIVGKTRKRKAREKLAEREKGFLPVLFVCLFVCFFMFVPQANQRR